MINGRRDYAFQVEASQKPFFARLGTPVEEKRHVVYDGGHVIYNAASEEVYSETLRCWVGVLGAVW